MEIRALKLFRVLDARVYMITIMHRSNTIGSLQCITRLWSPVYKKTERLLPRRQSGGPLYRRPRLARKLKFHGELEIARIYCVRKFLSSQPLPDAIKYKCFVWISPTQTQTDMDFQNCELVTIVVWSQSNFKCRLHNLKYCSKFGIVIITK